MKFEFILKDCKTKDVRYKCVTNEERFSYVKSLFDSYKLKFNQQHWTNDYYVFINKLDDNGHFIEVIQ